MIGWKRILVLTGLATGFAILMDRLGIVDKITNAIS